MEKVARRALVTGALASLIPVTARAEAEQSAQGPWIPASCVKELQRVRAELESMYEPMKAYAATLPQTGNDRDESEILREMNTLTRERLDAALAFADTFNALEAASTKAAAEVIVKWLSATQNRYKRIIASCEPLRQYEKSYAPRT